jgi:hypothetical protein
MSLFHYYKGVRIPLHSSKLRSHGRLIIIDESGEIGSISSFCVLAASVTDNIKRIEKITKVFPPSNIENKHYKSLDETKVKVLTEVKNCDMSIYAISYKKSKLDLSTPKKKHIHNLGQLLELIELVLLKDDASVYDIVIDNTTLIDGYEGEFVRKCYDIAGRCRKSIENIEMRDSSCTKVLQIHDYVAGTIGAHIESVKDAENECHERFRIIGPKIKEIINR